MTTPNRTTTHSPGPALRDSDRVGAFQGAQRRVLDRYGVAAEARFVTVPAIGGRAQVLVAGEGEPLVMVIGGTIPAAFWAPLMAHLPGRTLYAMDLPGFGLTDPVDYRPETYRDTAVAFLREVLDGLGVHRSQFVTNSMGSLWTHWLASVQPERVEAQVMVGCPAFFLGTKAPLPMCLASVPGLGRLLVSPPPSAKQVERVIAMVGEAPRGIDEVRDLLLACERLPAYTDSMLAMMRSVMSYARVRPSVVTGPDQLRAVAHPVQLIWGEDDAFGDVGTGRRIAELIPGGRFVSVPGGHAPWLHHCEPVAAVVREFLAIRREQAHRDPR
jgi:pimeloyl-ACP methyl ester carboxylesterase